MTGNKLPLPDTPENPATKKHDRLKAMLLEDLGSSEAVDEFLPTVQLLTQWDAPMASRAAEVDLLHHVTEEFVRQSISHPHSWHRQPLLLLRSQLRVVRAEIWLASAFVLTLGTLVTMIGYMPSADVMTPLAIIAPVVAALGIALLYDADVEQILELEDSTPTSARMLLLARLTLVFGFDLSLALAGSLALTLVNSQISLWLLVLSWLAPMTFLSGLAFLLSVGFTDSITGALFSFGLWLMHLMFRYFGLNRGLLEALSLPGLSASESRPLLFLAGVALVAVAFWLIGQRDRTIRGSQ